MDIADFANKYSQEDSRCLDISSHFTIEENENYSETNYSSCINNAVKHSKGIDSKCMDDIVNRSRDSLLTTFGLATLEDRYLMPGETAQDMFLRVARVHGDDDAHTHRLYDYMSNLWFMPATPILSNAGTSRGMPVSCFLNEASDSLEGIVSLWTENVWLASHGGGIGSYWGNLRAIGESIGGVGKTSGIIPFIHVMDSLTLAISQGSLRRGSAACYLPIWHPEIEEFVEMRRPTGGDANRKSLNLHHGIVLNDAFMQAVEKGEKWSLTSPKTGEVQKKVDARQLWIRVLVARIETGEPFILFYDAVAAGRPEWNKKAELTVKTSNLCLAGDTRIVTTNGLKTLKELFDSQESFAVSSDLRTMENVQAVFSGEKVRTQGSFADTNSRGVSCFLSSLVVRTKRNASLLKVTTKNGRVLRATSDHVVMTRRGWIRVGALNETDVLLIQSDSGEFSQNKKLPVPTVGVDENSCLSPLPSEWSEKLGSVLGWLACKWILYQNRWPSLVFDNNAEESGCFIVSYFQNILNQWFSDRVHLYTFSNVQYLVIKDERAEDFFTNLGFLKERETTCAGRYVRKHHVPCTMWSAPEDAVVGFLRGLFAANNGNDNDNNANGFYNSACQDSNNIFLVSFSLIFLREVQILLINFGVVAAIYEMNDCNNQNLSLSSDSEYSDCCFEKSWKLHIKENSKNKFMTSIGFICENKNSSVIDLSVACFSDESKNENNNNARYLENFEDGVASISCDGYEDVYDIVVDDSHSFIANGIVVHNCSEITLPTGLDHHKKNRTAVCCLSSLNLEYFDKWHDNKQFIPDIMRFLDNVLQDFIDRAPDSMGRARYSAMRERSVGLGVMGFHSFLQKNLLPWESALARAWNSKMFRHIQREANKASKLLADERGACPDAAEYGFIERFSHKTAVAPTASTSIICGGASPGIEPTVANSYTHKTLSGSFTVRNKYLAAILDKYNKNNEDTWVDIAMNKGSIQNCDFLSKNERMTFKTAFEIDQKLIIQLAADRTPFIDQSQSLNVFLPASSHKKYLHEIHMMAWKKGIKSLYYCRSLSVQRAETSLTSKTNIPNSNNNGEGNNDIPLFPSNLTVDYAVVVEDSEDGCLECQ